MLMAFMPCFSLVKRPSSLCSFLVAINKVCPKFSLIIFLSQDFENYSKFWWQQTLEKMQTCEPSLWTYSEKSVDIFGKIKIAYIQIHIFSVKIFIIYEYISLKIISNELKVFRIRTFNGHIKLQKCGHLNYLNLCISFDLSLVWVSTLRGCQIQVFEPPKKLSKVELTINTFFQKFLN